MCQRLRVIWFFFFALFAHVIFDRAFCASVCKQYFYICISVVTFSVLVLFGILMLLI